MTNVLRYIYICDRPTACHVNVIKNFQITNNPMTQIRLISHRTTWQAQRSAAQRIAFLWQPIFKCAARDRWSQFSCVDWWRSSVLISFRSFWEKCTTEWPGRFLNGTHTHTWRDSLAQITEASRQVLFWVSISYIYCHLTLKTNLETIVVLDEIPAEPKIIPFSFLKNSIVFHVLNVNIKYVVF